MKFFSRKGVSDLLWGLLILFTVNRCLAENFGINGDGGILFYRDNGQIYFGSGGVSYKYGSIFENELNFLRISYGMPWLSTEVSVIGYSAGIDANVVRPKIAGGVITSSDIKIVSDGAKIQNDGADGFYVGSSLGFDVRNIEITPSFFFASVKFGSGDFYKFYGRPDIPGLIHFGLSAEYEKTHKAGIAYERFDVDVLNNNAITLFQSNNYSVGMDYKYSLRVPQKPWEFYVVSGFNYAEISAGGALTAANQQYALFPYLFYRLAAGTADAFTGWTMLSLDIRGKYMEHSVKIGAGNVFGGKIYADAHYQYRKGFGDEEVNENIIDINPAGTGIVFSIYSLESRGLAVADGVHIYLGLRKILGYYWGMDKFTDIDGKEEHIPGEIDRKRFIKTLLLSGLSGNLRIMF